MRERRLAILFQVLCNDKRDRNIESFYCHVRKHERRRNFSKISMPAQYRHCAGILPLLDITLICFHFIIFRDTSFHLPEMLPRSPHAVWSLLTEREELIVAGWVVFRDSERLPTTTHLFKRFLSRYFDLYDVTPTWLHNLLKRQRISHQLPSKLKASEKQLETRLAMIKFLRDLRSRNLNPKQICYVDKTSFRIESEKTKQLSPTNTYKIVQLLYSLNLSLVVGQEGITLGTEERRTSCILA